ncbi:YhcN/YlaJ family sporulation lipoprotein [Brevibacillus dissolubilis]|uniref:YhcN/YlaJ family sporulation lipoprotein n=1 Tax=Brevibacillus dissolubilis TaxID=1844116 RepID=UPI0011177108|nr:YhcN/YlaJ family sporulation lipoprotein [Brevibacillus dissolubilis]
MKKTWLYGTVASLALLTSACGYNNAADNNAGGTTAGNTAGTNAYNGQGMNARNNVLGGDGMIGTNNRITGANTRGTTAGTKGGTTQSGGAGAGYTGTGAATPGTTTGTSTYGNNGTRGSALVGGYTGLLGGNNVGNGGDRELGDDEDDTLGRLDPRNRGTGTMGTRGIGGDRELGDDEDDTLGRLDPRNWGNGTTGTRGTNGTNGYGTNNYYGAGGLYGAGAGAAAGYGMGRAGTAGTTGTGGYYGGTGTNAYGGSYGTSGYTTNTQGQYGTYGNGNMTNTYGTTNMYGTGGNTGRTTGGTTTGIGNNNDTSGISAFDRSNYRMNTSIYRGLTGQNTAGIRSTERNAMNKMGYFKVDRNSMRTNSDQLNSVYVDRDALAQVVGNVTASVPGVNNTTVLVSDEEVFVGIRTENNRDGKTATTKARMNAMSVSPRYFKVYVTNNQAMIDELSRIASRGTNTNNLSLRNNDRTIENLVRRFGGTPDGAETGGTMTNSNLRGNRGVNAKAGQGTGTTDQDGIHSTGLNNMNTSTQGNTSR